MNSGNVIGHVVRVTNCNAVIRISSVSWINGDKLMNSVVCLNSNVRVSNQDSRIKDGAIKAPGTINAARRNPGIPNGVATTQARLATRGDNVSNHNGVNGRTIFARVNQNAIAGGKSANGRVKISEGRTTGVSTKAIETGCAEIMYAVRVSPISITARRATATI